MIKDIEKVKNIEYNLNILKVNNFLISESGNIYGHVKEFNKLKKDIKYEAHRVISKKALELCSKGKIFGSAIDVNGNIYLFEIFSDTAYRIVNVEIFKEIVEEVLNEKYIKKNS